MMDLKDPDVPVQDDESTTEEPKKSRRGRKLRSGARPKVTSGRELVREVFRRSLEANADEKVAREYRSERPRTRGDCEGGQRPCPWVGCKHHLYLSVNPESGAITINFPDREPGDLKETCALDVAERGGITLEEVGELTNVTRERIRQVETRALITLKRNARGVNG